MITIAFPEESSCGDNERDIWILLQTLIYTKTETGPSSINLIHEW